jgi:hypothetical protein
MSNLPEALRDVIHDEWCSVNLDDTPKCDCIKQLLNAAADALETAETKLAQAATFGERLLTDPADLNSAKEGE